MALSVCLSLGFFFLLGVGGKHWNTHVYNVTATDYKEAKFKLTANVFSFPVSLFVPSACPMRKGKKKEDPNGPPKLHSIVRPMKDVVPIA